MKVGKNEKLEKIEKTENRTKLKNWTKSINGKGRRFENSLQSLFEENFRNRKKTEAVREATLLAPLSITYFDFAV